MALPGAVAHLLDHFGDDLREIERHTAKAGRLARVGAGQQQQIAHQPTHARCFFLRFQHGLAPRLLGHTLPPQQRQVAANDRDRVTQLVRGISQQSTLRLQDVLEARDHIVERRGKKEQLIALAEPRRRDVQPLAVVASRCDVPRRGGDPRHWTEPAASAQPRPSCCRAA